MTPSRIGRYEVQRRLGTGGMGALYLARDPHLDRLVAIKLLKEDLQDDSGLRERFIREARSVARLRHANIVIVYDVGEDAGRPFMAMEYIAGETLAHVLRQRPTPPLTRRLAMIEDLCAGLAHAHGAGIIHRDIKPANMMLDGDGVLKILDFGIARLVNSGMTQEGMMMGTVNYMSPEQVTGRGVDHRTDIFAAGAVLYEAISLEQAFPGRIDTGVLHRILTDGPTPLNQLVPAIDTELLGIVQRALERDPSQRYQDASVMRRDIQRARRRLMDEGSGHLIDSRATTAIIDSKPPPSGAGRRPDSDRPRRLNPERFAELQRQQVAEHLRFGEEAFARGDHDAALQHAERAATVDPDSRDAFDLIDRVRFAIEARAIRQLLTQAQRLLAGGQLEDAAALAEEASVTLPEVHGAAELRAEVRQIVEKIATARDREQRIVASLDRARASLERGGYETALRAVYEVLSIDPDRAEARALEQQAQTRLQAQREHERARRAAYDVIARARALADQGKFEDAAAAIAQVTPPSDTVRVAAADALNAVRAAQRQAVLAAIMSKAREAIDRQQYADALTAIDSIPADEQTRDAIALRATAERALREQRELERKRNALDASITAIEALIERGELASAQERLDAAWTIGLTDQRLPALGSRLRQLAAEAEARRQQQVRDRLAAQRVEAARQLLANGDGYAAVTLLERDAGHPLVEQALREIRAAIVEQEERVRQEAERRRQEEEAKRRAELEAARKLDEQRKAEEQQRRLEEERRREAQRQRHRQEAATLLVDAERAIAADRPDEATVLLKRADEHIGSAEDTELRRRLAEMKASAERQAQQRLEEQRKEEERQRRREEERRREADRQRHRQEVSTLLVDAERAMAAERPDEATVLLKRADEHVGSAEDTELLRRVAEMRASAERLAQQRLEEIRRQEEEARKREQMLADLLQRAHATQAHETALTILDEAMTLAPTDTRVQQRVTERRAALEQQRLEEQRAREEEARRIDEARKREAVLAAQRAAEAARAAEESARLAREREAHREREAKAEIERQRLREEQRQRQLERRAARAAAIASAVRDRRVQVAAAVVVGLSLVATLWQNWPAPVPELAVNESPAPASGTPSPRPASPPPVDSVPPPVIAPQPTPAPLPPQTPARGGTVPGVAPGVARPGSGRVTAPGNQPTSTTTTPPVETPAAGGGVSSPQTVPTPAPVDPPGAAPQPQPQQPAAPPVSTPPPPVEPRVDVAAERAAIQQIITRYAAAYSRMDENELRRIDPGFTSIPSKVLLKSVEVTPSAISIDVDQNGQTATARFTQNFRYEWNRARLAPTASGNVSWNLRKVGGAWTVVR